MTPPTATAETPRTRRTRKPAAAGKTTAAKSAKAGTKAPVAGEAASRSLSTIDLTEELDVPQVAELVARGRENGELSLAELKETLDKADLGAELLPALVRRLGEAKVDVVEEDDRPVKPSTSEASGTGDLVRLYLREIGKVPLLNAEQEVELSKRVEAGLFAFHKLNHGGEMKPALRR
ncbi:MAG: polymerase primary sigma factor, partial [Frankiaceae bacterium]|nr:polymerase primary sigma factor [Frankiaceae bacterium]